MSDSPDAIKSAQPADDSTDTGTSTKSGTVLADTLARYRSSPYMSTLNEVAEYTTQAYLNDIDPAAPPSPKRIEQHLLTLFNKAAKVENAKTKFISEKIPLQRTLGPIQVAMIIAHLHRAAEVTPGGAEQDDGLGVLCIYQPQGEFIGLYRRADLGLLEGLALQYNFTHSEKWLQELERCLRGIAPKVTETVDPDLIVTPDEIYHYSTGERTPFTPDLVFLARSCATTLIAKQHPVPQVLDKEGRVIWDYEQWWAETVPDEETRRYLWQVMGAAYRPRHDWQVMPALYADSGSNGKGTILEHIRAMIGTRNCASVPLADYSKSFGTEPLIGKRLNLPDETDVGAYFKDASIIKAIITNDRITVNRKHKPAISYKPAMFTILTLNGPLNFKDKTASMDRRLAIIPMTQRFMGAAKNKAIKDDYLKRREVCEYMMHKLLVEMPKYWELEEPESVTKALQEHKLETNTVLAWFEDYHAEFERVMLPFPMLHATYTAWLRSNRPDSKPVAAPQFTKEIKALVDPDVWVVPTAGDGRDLKLTSRSWLTKREPVLDEFHYSGDVGQWQWTEFIGDRGLGKSAPRQVRGLLRRDVYEAWCAAGCPAGPDGVEKVLSDLRRQQYRAQVEAAKRARAESTDEPGVAA